MNILSALARPEYVFRPSQIIRRILCEFRSSPAGYETVRLPWGSFIRIWPGESQGSCIRRLGIHDLVTSEVIWRLLDPDECAVDVGANIGHMTNVMAVRVGPRGRVIAVEPHPGLFKELQYNVGIWSETKECAPIASFRLALSNYSGGAILAVPSGFGSNRGLCSLIREGTSHCIDTDVCEVEAKTLDQLIGSESAIGVLKIDVEGHEIQVLEGAKDLMSRSGIRDIVFEEHSPPPTPVTTLLKENGYSIFHLDGTLLEPLAVPITVAYVRKIKDAPNYLATRDPVRALARMSKKGWAVYSLGRFSVRSSMAAAQ